MSTTAYNVIYNGPKFTETPTFTGRRAASFQFIATDKDTAIRHAEKLMNSPVEWEQNGMTVLGHSDNTIADPSYFYGSIVVFPLPLITTA